MNRDPKTTRILLLDDDPWMLKLLGHFLAQLGYIQVFGYESGPQALQQVAHWSSHTDVIFLDINMPGMDGIEFIRELVKRGFCGGVVLVSGENDRTLESVKKLIESQKLNSLGHLAKPVQPEELSRLLRQTPTDHRKPAGRVTAADFTGEDLRAALVAGELVNYYQPKVALTSAELVGVESLVRWQHPRAGLIFPDQFIALAEDYGLIRTLTRTVLAAAMRQAKLWRLAGHDIPVAINVSMDDVTALDFPDTVAMLAASNGIDPARITLEVTEGKLMKRLSAALDVLTRLRLKRFRLAIDDFGTGHSSLALLRDLPFDELKVDRGFVHGAATDPRLRALCNASLRLAHQLRLDVVGEGIEDRADWEYLQKQGCDAGQGYFIARPMQAGEVLGWKAAWETQQRNALAIQA